jgi:fatty-acyl-CoA synthase
MLFWNSINTGLRLSITQNDRAVIFLPLFHTGGWNVLTTPFFHHGAQIILTKKFAAEQVLRLSEQKKCTLLFGVPTTMEMMASSADFRTSDLSHLRYAIVGGEPMPIPAIQVWNKKGVPIRQGYGLTEFGPNVFSLNEQDAERKAGSIGFPNFYIDTKIVDSSGKEVGANQIGELWLKGPMAMTGYWKNLKATDEVFQKSWLATGDLVRKDDEGYFYVVGRKKEMFISGGENIYPAEVEAVLRQLPEVLEAAVIGAPDVKWGEVGKAFVVLNSNLSEAQVREHCLTNLAKFKVPKTFHFLAHLPKNESGKILKRALIEIKSELPLFNAD